LKVGLGFFFFLECKKREPMKKENGRKEWVMVLESVVVVVF
jgi:hypothetical protein